MALLKSPRDVWRMSAPAWIRVSVWRLSMNRIWRSSSLSRSSGSQMRRPNSPPRAPLDGEVVLQDDRRAGLAFRDDPVVAPDEVDREGGARELLADHLLALRTDERKRTVGKDDGVVPLQLPPDRVALLAQVVRRLGEVDRHALRRRLEPAPAPRRPPPRSPREARPCRARGRRASPSRASATPGRRSGRAREPAPSRGRPCRTRIRGRPGTRRSAAPAARASSRS